MERIGTDINVNLKWRQGDDLRLMPIPSKSERKPGTLLSLKECETISYLPTPQVGIVFLSHGAKAAYFGNIAVFSLNLIVLTQQVC